MSRDAARRVLVMAFSVAAVAPAAQSPPAVDIESYRRLVMEYMEGDPGIAVAAIATRPPNTTKAIINTRNLGWSPEIMRAAAMLETDAAFNSRDAMTFRLSSAELWLERAHDALPPHQPDTFWPQWSVVVGRKALWMKIAGVADPMLKKACDVFNDDARVHLAYGLARESSSFAMGSGVPLEVAMRLAPSNSARMDAVFDARRALVRALELDPGSAEARLRLAHVHLLLKDERRAAPLLEQILALGAPPIYRYLASIMLGDVRARAGRLQPAIDLYLDARRLMPTGQSSYIAHAHALSAAGRADAAAGVLREMLMRAPHDDDPWALYPRGFDPDATQLDPLRALVRKK